MGAIDFQDVFEDFFHFRVKPNKPNHLPPIWSELPAGSTSYQLAVMEFDDQGLVFQRSHMQEFETGLNGFAGQKPIILVFAHGWKNNGAPENGNLASFQAVLASTAQAQAACVAPRPVVGIFLAWRGLSSNGNWAWTQLSFWGRQQAAERVALGSPRELLGRLRAFRNDAPEGDVTLIIVGHSFGGRVVYSALAQSLIDAAGTAEPVIPSFADLVVLVNPAFSAISYLPIYDIVTSRGRFDAAQIPVFVAVTAENDDATKILFPLGNFLRLAQEDCATAKEREALIRTMGHIPWLRTHELCAAPAPVALKSQAAAQAAMANLSRGGVVEDFGGVRVTAAAQNIPHNPFWVAAAKKEVVNGHVGIFQPLFIEFLHALVAAHIHKSDAPAGQYKRLR